MVGYLLSCPRVLGLAGLQQAGSSYGLCFSGTKLATQFPCPRGYYNPDQLTQSLDGCLPCPPGHYCGQENLTQASGPCDAGAFPRAPQRPPPPPTPPTSGWTSHDGTSSWSGYREGQALRPGGAQLWPWDHAGPAATSLSPACCRPPQAGSACRQPGPPAPSTWTTTPVPTACARPQPQVASARPAPSAPGAARSPCPARQALSAPPLVRTPKPSLAIVL